MTRSQWTDAPLPELAEALKTALLLPGEPVGVMLFTDPAAFEAWPFPRPEAPLYYCSAVRMASVGVALKLGLPDISCDTSPRTLGLVPGFSDPDFTQSYVDGGLYRDIDVARRILAEVATLSGTAGVAIAALGDFPAGEPPHVTIVSTTPYGIMRVTQAAAFHGHSVRNQPIGMHGICAESTAAPRLTGEVSVSLLCSGTRYISGWDEHLMSAGIPQGLLAEVVDGLLATTQRFETDERKQQMRTSCRCRPGPAPALSEEIGTLEPGTGYFCGR